MTFMLDEYDPAKVPAPRGPDVQPQGFFSSFGTATAQTMVSQNANWESQQRDAKAMALTAEQAARRLGFEKMRPILMAANQSFDEMGIPENMKSLPDTAAEFSELVGPFSSEAILKAARDDAAANPELWADMDLTEEGIKARVTEQLIQEDADRSDILAMSNTPFMANLMGGIGAAILDVRQAPLLVMGGSGSFLRVVGTEATLGAAGEAVTLPSQYEMAKRLNKPDPNAVEALIGGAIGGAVLGGAIDGLSRGLAYFRGRSELPKGLKGIDPVTANAIIDAAERALVNDENPLAAVQRVMRAAPEAAQPSRPPLIPETARKPAEIKTQTLPPMTGDAPRSPAEVSAVARESLDSLPDLESFVADARAADNAKAKPLISFLRNNHVVTKGEVKAAEKAGRAAPTASANYQIDPAGPLGQELKAQGITSKTNPGLFKKGGRSDLDNLVVREMEDQFPGIIEATRTPSGADYLDQQGLIDLIVRDANGDGSWLRSRADLQKAEAELDFAQRVADGEVTPAIDDYLSGARSDDPDSLYFSQDEAGFLDASDVSTAFDGWIDRTGRTGLLTPQERFELVGTLQQYGGDAQNLIEAMWQREINYAKSQRRNANGSPIAGQEPPPSKDMAGSYGVGFGPRGDASGPAGSAARVADDGGTLPQGQQSIIPGTDRVDTGQSQRDAATIAARQQQSKIGRLDQTRIEDDAGGLFDPGDKARSDMFDSPTSQKAKQFDDARVNELRTSLDEGDDFEMSISADDGRELGRLSDVLQEIDEIDAMAREIELCRLGKVSP